MKHTPFLEALQRTGFKPSQGNRFRFLRKREMQKTQIVDVPVPPEVKQDRDKERVFILTYLQQWLRENKHQEHRRVA